MKRILSLSLVVTLAVLALHAQDFTRGIGAYPGNPNEYTGPSARIDETSYRNLALRRPAYHSSAYDYNLTAQLITDGIKETNTPLWISTETSRSGVLPKNEREYLLDGNWVTNITLPGAHGWVQINIGGGQPPEVDWLEIDARVFSQSQQPENWTCTVLGSDDGENWRQIGQAVGMARPGGEVRPSIPLGEPSRHRFYRAVFQDPRAASWQVNQITFFNGARRVPVGGPYSFTSAWMSAGQGEEWVYVDLGAACSIDRVVLHWISRAAKGSLQVSDDARAWRSIQALPEGDGLTDDIRLTQQVKGRYVRLLMTQPDPSGSYVLSEMEVYGRGGPVPQSQPAPSVRPDGRQDLAGGGWRLQRDSLVSTSGEMLSTPGFSDAEWLIATVPGTVLVSYLNAGALPDPNYSDNQLQISDSFFHADFWYRNEFDTPSSYSGKRVWLNFDGVNWKADVYLNGASLGRIEGAFTRARFDVTDLLAQGQKNALAVRIIKNASPGSIKEQTFQSPDKNGGFLGEDNPTFHASVGWDWIPTIRGRNTGIWNDVFLTATGPVTIEDHFISTALPLPETSRADVNVEVTLRNHESRQVSGVLRGQFGDAVFESPITLEAFDETTLRLDPSTHPALRLSNPRLWWPTGYGEPNLYDVELRFETGDRQTSDLKSFKAGVRQFTYSEEGGDLRMWINGRRFIARGGNWGFSESMLRYRGREYDTAVRYHREQNFTMIRNWVGQTGDEEFYEACDRHGVVVWQDFWLANPWDGPDPADDEMFIRNVEDYVRRIRNHASVGLYCGRNEGYPPSTLDDPIREVLADLHPDLHYISSSADDVASGHGPYQRMPLNYYFEQRATPKMHGEMGMPNIVSMDSLRLMMPESAMWPQGGMWGLHDFCLKGAQGAASFIEMIRKSYGAASNVEEWVKLAQFVNYEGYRAMFEAQSKNRMGLVIWMSHSSWPSLVWQTYDYFFEPAAGYYGAKKASEPLHIQWNAFTDSIEVVNYSAGDVKGLTARVEILNLDNASMWNKTASLDSPEDSVASPIKMEYPSDLTPVHFLRLRLTRGDELISENFYWRGTRQGDYNALRQLPDVVLEAETTLDRQGETWYLSTELRNPSEHPALMVKVKAVREKSGDRILPAIYSDNFVALMPGESRTITTELAQADTRGETPHIVVEGFNTAE